MEEGLGNTCLGVLVLLLGVVFCCLFLNLFFIINILTSQLSSSVRRFKRKT